MKKKLLVAALALAALCALTAVPVANAATPATPVGVKGAAVSTSSVKVSWNKVKGAAGYDVQLSTAKAMASPVEKETATKTSVTYSGLKTGTTYYVRVRAYKTSGGYAEGSWSAARTCSTKPGKPGSVAVAAPTKTSLKVSWAKSAGATGYQVRWSLKKGMKKAKTAKTASLSKTISKLKACRYYYVQVRAYRKSAAGTTWGDWTSKRKAATVPTPKGLKVAANGASTDRATWSSVACASGYQVRYSRHLHMKGSKASTTARCRCDVAKGCYVQVRAYKKSGKAKVYGAWGELSKAGAIAKTWAQLKAASNAIGACATESAALAKAQSYGLLGSSGELTGSEVKIFTLADGTNCEAQILGFWHDTKAGGGKAGITFGFKQVVDWHAMNPTDTNSGGWKSSSMRAWLNSSFYNLLPSDLRSQIVAVSKMTNNTGETEDASSVTATSDRLWLLSMVECYGTFSDSDDNSPSRPEVYNAEGSQYKLYADNGVTVDNYGFLVKYDTSGRSRWWWLRSPGAGSSSYFHYVYDYGGWGRDYADYSYGVSPGFCL